MPTRPKPAIVITPETTRMVLEFEVISRAYYERQLTGLICPGGASGPTGGIGYDFGHQSPGMIRFTWGWHPQIEALVRLSGAVGDGPCRTAVARAKEVRISWADGVRVFEQDTLPRYARLARHAYGTGYDLLMPNGQGSLTSNTQNRGSSMTGARARHKRAIRDNCLPTTDHSCLAAQLAAQCVLWEGTPIYAGLCRRRKAESQLAITWEGTQ